MIVLRCSLALFLTLAVGVLLGLLLVPLDAMEHSWRVSFHIYSFVICFAPDWILRKLARQPVQMVTGFMLSQLIRLTGLLFLYIILIFIHKTYAYTSLWIFLASVAAFLCFQVVRAAHPRFCGGERS